MGQRFLPQIFKIGEGVGQVKIKWVKSKLNDIVELWNLVLKWKIVN